MKRTYLSFFSFCFLCVFYIGVVHADTINLTGLPSTTYSGYYVGGLTGNINGGYSMQFYCDDFATTTYVPSSFAVAINNLSDISQTKFGGTTDALLKYQQVGWLLGEMANHPAEVGPIQFAAWSILTPSTPAVPGASEWVAAARGINPANYDFSSVRIYTATNTKNQEFVSGGAHALPEPNVLPLFCLGFFALFLYTKITRRTAVVSSN